MGINLGNLASEPSPEILAQPGVEQVQTADGGLTLNLTKKGMSLDLSKAAPSLVHTKVGLGWDAVVGESMDLDVFALLLHNGKIQDNSDIIYFNQRDTGKHVVLSEDNRTGVGEGDDESISIDLSQVPQNIDSIAIFVNIYQAEAKQQNFGMVPNAYIRLVNEDTNKEECIFILNEKGGLFNALHFADLKRNGTTWNFETIGDGINGDVSSIASSYQ